MPFEIGSCIQDRSRGITYTLLEPLGNGSYAVVYKVRSMQSNKLYALKCLSRANLAPHHLSIQRNEAILHQRLSTKNVGHPNLVTLYYSFETPDWLFLVLEYCEGQDLYYWLTQNHDNCDPTTGRELSERQRIQLVKQIFLQILDVVGYCHANGIAHRDLKPENFIVMSKKNGGVQVKLTDFGLATDEEESPDFDCGSKPYMSYECCNQVRDTYNPRLADMWSLGIVFLNLLYHRSPWTDPNPRECKAFAEFQSDKTGFLMHRFESMPREVAQFLGNRVFCGEEEGRVSVKEWKAWCNNIVVRLLGDDHEEKSEALNDAVASTGPNSFPTLERTLSNEQTHARRERKPSWSDVVDELGPEMDFSEPLIFNDNNDDHPDGDDDDGDDAIVQRSQPKRKAETAHSNQVSDDGTTAENDVDHGTDANAQHSDADSGFGSDGDCAGHKIRERQIASDRNEAPLSHSPPKVIYCKLRPWGEQRARADGYAGGAVANSHWSSYHQRRERLEQRRDKEARLDRWIQQHRQEAPIDSSKAFDVEKDAPSLAPTSASSNYPRRARVRSLHQASKPARDATRSRDSFVGPLRTKHMLPRNDEASPIHAKPRVRPMDDTPRVHPGKRPQKVTRSTKYNLGKMLEKMVVFNRGIKIGGQEVNA